MAAQFQDLAEMLDPRLPLPIRGKTYFISDPGITVGLRAQATVAIATKVKNGVEVSAEDVAALQLDDAEEIDFTKSMLGDTFAEMQADDIPWEYVRHAARTAFMWLVADRDEAAKVWRNLGKAPRPVPQDRKPKKKPASGGKTKKASSPNSSTSRRTPASRGATSSPTGT
jgi:hypothetical protein